MLSLERQAYSLIPRKRKYLLPSHYSFLIFKDFERGGGKFPKVLPWTSRLPVLYRDPLRERWREGNSSILFQGKREGEDVLLDRDELD